VNDLINSGHLSNHGNQLYKFNMVSEKSNFIQYTDVFKFILRNYGSIKRYPVFTAYSARNKLAPALTPSSEEWTHYLDDLVIDGLLAYDGTTGHGSSRKYKTINQFELN